MPHATKIATCCYCGTRAALVLRGKTRHELSCSACGAPLHDLKMLRKDRTGDRELVVTPNPKRKVKATRPGRRVAPAAVLATASKKKRKRRKSLLSRVMEEAFDAIEDIFD
ncbi:hypothetical protein [Pukyongiella litopenaei]|uniref:Uncharacterized protein n=1 Tax=Pukyongiella litopenaei TaxID=2605946 RepID=A0A2S0MND9_9RHOB|nr:hypothetical protein [Pukyongiella litopenaei]AVO37356.1 hypothetical protein C6Y53_06295 [Pukyongiella litopenaei]